MVVECSKFCIMSKKVNVQISFQTYLIVMTYMTKNNHVEAYVSVYLFIHTYIKSNDEYGFSHPSKILSFINNVANFLFKKMYIHMYIANLGKGVATSPHSNQKHKLVSFTNFVLKNGFSKSWV